MANFERQIIQFCGPDHVRIFVLFFQCRRQLFLAVKSRRSRAASAGRGITSFDLAHIFRALN